MGSMSVWHWLIVLAVVLIAFGGSGRISSIMGDVAKGIKSFKKGMQDDEEPKKPDPAKPQDQIMAAKPGEPSRAENKVG
jgi:sec-independent protein translocase protein TatA